MTFKAMTTGLCKQKGGLGWASRGQESHPCSGRYMQGPLFTGRGSQSFLEGYNREKLLSIGIETLFASCLGPGTGS